MEWNPRINPAHPLRTGHGCNVKVGLRTTLYLGRSISAGQEVEVSAYALSSFLKDFVSVRFLGFTVEHGQGYWKGRREDVAILSFLYPLEVAWDAGVKVEEIRAEYVRLFSQESVLRTDETVKLSFD